MSLPSTTSPARAAPLAALAAGVVQQYVVTAMSAVLVHMLLQPAGAAHFGGARDRTAVTDDRPHSDHEQQQEQQERAHAHSSTDAMSASSSAPNRGSDSIHQTGTKYRSNNAGDGPEKTRDRKSWFPRFKSNWLGTYRSKQMFHCCECAVVDAQSARYKGSEGKHCACGQDQWHLAKTIEEAEYNRRMEISKALGGLRYDEALERLKAMGTSEHDLKRLRCESDEASVSSSCSSIDDHSVDSSSTDGAAPHASKRIKNEPSGSERGPPLPSPATRAYGSQLRRTSSAGSSGFGLEPVSALPSATSSLTAELLQKINHSYSSGMYTPLGGDYSGGPAAYDHLVPPPFADEEGFGELLQGFLEDDPRSSTYPSYLQQQQQQYNARYTSAPLTARPAAHYSSSSSYHTPFLSGSIPPNDQQLQQQQRYPQAPSTLPPPPLGDVDFEFFPDSHARSAAPPTAAAGAYYAPHMQQLPYGTRPHLAHPQHSSIV